MFLFGHGKSVKREKDEREMMRQFGVRQNRQFLAISVTLLLLVVLTLLYKRQDLFGEFSKMFIVSAQIVTIGVFVVFSFFNWRCPSCRKYLGADINRHSCKRCGMRLR